MSPDPNLNLDPDRDVSAIDGRHETETQRNDRNWTEILQELRVIQTGTQILTGFLLTLAFQPRFASLDQVQVGIYLGLVVAAALATTLALMPVVLHRALFRHQAKEVIVRDANRILKATLGVVGLTLAGTTMLVFDVVLGSTAGIVAGASTVLVVAVAWIVFPADARRRMRRS